MTRKPKHWDGTMRFGIFWPGARTLLPSEKISALSPDVLNLENHLALTRACEAVALDSVLLGDGHAPSSKAGTQIGFQNPGLYALILAGPSSWRPSTRASFRPCTRRSSTRPTLPASAPTSIG